MIKDKVTTIHHGLSVFKIMRKAENPFFFFCRMGGYIKNETEKTKQTSKSKGAAPIRQSLKGRRMMGYIYGIITVPIRQIKCQCNRWSNKGLTMEFAVGNGAYACHTHARKLAEWGR